MMTQEFWIVLLAATVSGALGSLIGAGGGFLLMPFLLFLYSDGPHSNLTLYSLIFVFMNSLVASFGYQKKGRISWKWVALLSFGALPGSWIGAVLNQNLPRESFQRIFGILLLCVAIFVFWKSLGKRGHTENSLNNEDSSPSQPISNSSLLQWVVLGFGVGVISSFSGVGGGILQVPVMIYWFQLPVLISTATSQATIVVSSAIGIIKHIALLADHNRNILDITSPFPPGGMDPIQILALVIGALIGGPIGVFFSSKINPKWISILMAALLFLAGARLAI